MSAPATTASNAHPQLVFSDSFKTFVSSPDGSQGWMTTYPYGGEGARSLYGNSEAEYYSDSSVGENPFLDSNGILSITASVAAPGSNPYGLPYDSGLITTYKSFSMTYGIFAVRAELPAGQGLWPAFWLLPASNHYSSELDVFEQLGQDPTTIYSTTHGMTNGVWGSNFNTFHVPNASTGFHTYAVNWEPHFTQFMEDGHVLATVPTPDSMNQPMYMLLNLAVGGNGSWPGPAAAGSIPATMKIDWVRAYATANSTDISGTQALPLPTATASTALTMDDWSAGTIKAAQPAHAAAAGAAIHATRVVADAIGGHVVIGHLHG